MLYCRFAFFSVFRRPMNAPLLLTAALPFCPARSSPGCSPATRRRRNSLPLMQSLTECRQHLEFAEQNQAQTASELADARYPCPRFTGRVAGWATALPPPNANRLSSKTRTGSRSSETRLRRASGKRTTCVRNERLTSSSNRNASPPTKAQAPCRSPPKLGRPVPNLANTILEEKSRRFTRAKPRPPQ